MDEDDRLDPVGEGTGYLLLTFMHRLGWQVLVTADRAQSGRVLVQAWKGETVIEREGGSVVEVAYPVFCEAVGFAPFAGDTGRSKKGEAA